jgi:hypothetical protein
MITSNGNPDHFYHSAPRTSTGPCEICMHGYAQCVIDHIHMCISCAKTYVEAELSLSSS